MENREELLSELLRRIQRNYVRIVEIERQTRELGDALSRNDQESAQLIVKMRQDEMEQAAQVKQEIQMLLQTVPVQEREKLKGWLEGRSDQEPDSYEAKKIIEIGGQLTQVLNRTISIDKAINVKIAGKDSFYQRN